MEPVVSKEKTTSTPLTGPAVGMKLLMSSFLIASESAVERLVAAAGTAELTTATGVLTAAIFFALALGEAVVFLSFSGPLVFLTGERERVTLFGELFGEIFLALLGANTGAGEL